MVLLEHVRVAALHLALDDLRPQVFRLNGCPASALSFLLLLESLECLTLDCCEALGFVGTEQGPFSLFYDTLHE